MTCVAVTRGGFGDLWLFDNRGQADSHPIVQYGDAIVSDPDDVLEQYNLLELPRLAGVLDNEDLSDRILGVMNETRHKPDRLRRKALVGLAPRVFDEMVRLSSGVPSDPSEIVDIVTKDRELTKQKELQMNDTATAEKKTNRSKFPDDAKITFGTDKDGNAYGPKNNPKREGTKSHALFELYKSGMTVAKYLAAGGTTAALNWDSGKGFIKIG